MINENYVNFDIFFKIISFYDFMIYHNYLFNNNRKLLRNSFNNNHESFLRFYKFLMLNTI